MIESTDERDRRLARLFYGKTWPPRPPRPPSPSALLAAYHALLGEQQRTRIALLLREGEASA